MRIITVLIFTGLIALSACNKEQLVKSSLKSADASSLPATTTQYVNDNYPDAVITNVDLYSTGTARYVVNLNTTEVLAFDYAGGFLCDSTAIDTIPGDSLPPDGMGHHGHHGHHGGPGGCHGGHSGFGGDHHGNGGPEPGFGHGHGHGIPVDSLGSAITGYVTSNYPAYTIVHADVDTLCQFGNVTEVVVCDSLSHVKLYFDAGNTYLMKDERIDYSIVPAVISAYVTTNYATFHPKHKAIKMTLADGNFEYMVFLEYHHNHKRVTFKEDGTFVCEQ